MARSYHCPSHRDRGRAEHADDRARDDRDEIYPCSGMRYVGIELQPTSSMVAQPVAVDRSAERRQVFLRDCGCARWKVGEHAAEGRSSARSSKPRRSAFARLAARRQFARYAAGYDSDKTLYSMRLRMKKLAVPFFLATRGRRGRRRTRQACSVGLGGATGALQAVDACERHDDAVYVATVVP